MRNERGAYGDGVHRKTIRATGYRLLRSNEAKGIRTFSNKYILLDVLACSIAEYSIYTSNFVFPFSFKDVL